MPSHGHASHGHAAHHHTTAFHHSTPIHHHHFIGGNTHRISANHPLHRLTTLFLTPEMIAYRKQVEEINKSIDPPLSVRFTLRFAGLLHFVLLPLIIATVATPWYVIDGAGKRAWDGTTTTTVERQAGYLTLTEYQDCTKFAWSSPVEWDSCYFGETIFDSTAADSLKRPSRAAFSLLIVLLITSFFGLFRHIRTCGMRTSRVGDEWLLKWTWWTRVQLLVIALFAAIALGVYSSAVPDFVVTTVGPGNHHFAAGQSLAVAIIVIALVSLLLYTIYAIRISSWAAAHPIPELPPMPEPPTPESVAAQLGAEMARGMMMAQAGGLPVAGMAGPNGVMPYPPPPGAFPPGAYPPPPGAYPPGAFPPGAFPPGAFPPGAFPPGAFPPGYGYPPGMFPPGMFPPGMGAMGGMQQQQQPGAAPYNPGGATPMGGPDDPSEGDGMKSPTAADMPSAPPQLQQQQQQGGAPGAAPYPPWAAPHTAENNPLPQGMFTNYPYSNDTAPRGQGQGQQAGAEGIRAPPLGTAARQVSAGDPSEAPQL